MITSFNLYESLANRFDFGKYLVSYATDEEALYFAEEMQKKGYNFYDVERIVDEVKDWGCFIYSSDDNKFVLADYDYYKREGHIELNIEEAFEKAEIQNQDYKPVIRWYKKGKLEK